MKKTNFDRYLEAQLRDPDFAARFKAAGEAWDVSLQIVRLRERAGLSQKELAERLATSQQQVSRLESPAYEGHSLSMLRRIAAALKARVRVVIEPLSMKRNRSGRREKPAVQSQTAKAKKTETPRLTRVAEEEKPYRAGRRK